jgi:hypothetical protein
MPVPVSADQRGKPNTEILHRFALRPLVSIRQTVSASKLEKRLCFEMEFLNLHEKLSTFRGKSNRSLTKKCKKGREWRPFFSQ